MPGGTQVPDESRSTFAYGTITLYGWLFHTILLAEGLVTPKCRALQPQPGKPDWFGLIPVRSPLLGEWSLFLWVLRCFSSPGSLHRPYVFRSGCRWIAAAGFPIRKSSDLHLYTASRGLSQCPTSFIGVWRQGIHRVPLVTCSRDAEKSNFFSYNVDALSIQLVRCCCGEPVGLPPGGAHCCQHHSAMAHLRNTARLTAGLFIPIQCALSLVYLVAFIPLFVFKPRVFLQE